MIAPMGRHDVAPFAFDPVRMAHIARLTFSAILQAGCLVVAALLAAATVAERRPDLTLEAGIVAVLIVGLVLCRPPMAGAMRAPPRFREHPGARTPNEGKRTIRTADGCVWKPVGGSMSTRLMRYGCTRCGKVGYGAMGQAPLACLKNSKVPQL